jgi:hypothetical protein
VGLPPIDGCSRFLLRTKREVGYICNFKTKTWIVSARDGRAQPGEKEMASTWPKDTMEAKIAFYGDPRGPHGESPTWRSKNEARIKPPFKMFFAGKEVKSIAVHKKIADAVTAALNEIWENCDKDQKTVDKAGASDYAGTFNFRVIAGSNPPRLSNHSFGCAIDLSPKTNGFNTGKGTISNIVVDAFKRQGARWGGDFKKRTDPMHFEFVS